jgi:hypothetical protein
MLAVDGSWMRCSGFSILCVIWIVRHLLSSIDNENIPVVLVQGWGKKRFFEENSSFIHCSLLGSHRYFSVI